MCVQYPIDSSYCHVFSSNTKPEYKEYRKMSNQLGEGRGRIRKMCPLQAVKTALNQTALCIT